MSTFYGSNATLRDNTKPAQMISVTDEKARVRWKYDTYAVPSAGLAAGDLINMMKLPAGSRIVNAVLFTDELDSGSACTLDIGWAANASGDSASATGILSGVSAHGASPAVQTMYNQAAPPSGLFNQFAGEVQVQVKCHTAPGTAMAGTIRLGVEYVID